eukprot:1136240-Pelagomonas_calceolata.AAC.10
MRNQGRNFKSQVKGFTETLWLSSSTNLRHGVCAGVQRIDGKPLTSFQGEGPTHLSHDQAVEELRPAGSAKPIKLTLLIDAAPKKEEDSGCRAEQNKADCFRFAHITA